MKFTRKKIVVALTSAILLSYLATRTWTKRVELNSGPVSLPRTVLTDLLAASESEEHDIEAELNPGTYDVVFAGQNWRLIVPRNEKIAFKGSATWSLAPFANGRVNAQYRIGDTEVVMSSPITLRNPAGIVVDVDKLSTKSTKDTNVDVKFKVSLAETLVGNTIGRLVGIAPVSSTSAAKIIATAKANHLTVKLREDAVLNLGAAQSLVIGSGGEVDLSDSNFAGVHNLTAKFRASVPLKRGTIITAQDFTIEPMSATLTVEGSYERIGTAEHLDVREVGKSPLLTAHDSQLMTGKTPVAALTELTLATGQLEVWRDGVETKIHLEGTGSLAAKMSDLSVPGATVTVDGLRAERFKMALTTGDGVPTTFDSELGGLSTGAWTITQGGNGAATLTTSGTSLALSDAKFSKLASLALIVPSAALKVSSVTFSNERARMSAVLAKDSTLSFATQQPIRISLGKSQHPEGAGPLGEFTCDGTFPSVSLRVGSKQVTIENAKANFRFVSAGTPRIAGSAKMTIAGTSLSGSIKSALGAPDNFNIGELRVNDLSVKSGDVQASIAFDLAGLREGNATIDLAAPGGFEVNATGVGLRDSRLDAAITARAFRAIIDLDRGEAQASLDFDVVNRSRVSPLTMAKDIDLVFDDMTVRAWMFIKPFTVSLRVTAAARVEGDGRITLTPTSWTPLDPKQGIDIDSDTHKMPGVHGTIQPIDKSEVTLHVNYFGDVGFSNPLQNALNKMMGKAIAIHN